ncbi:peroxide stress protein YaaA [Comamonas sp. NLF-1-9]|uniref:peroxide stress protein YaaA n=1 Tax=Comamonas sp. NLF-1-9 TaxID=2853163 RepID=UPI001C457853|nr:peroxide stress protein YaaA [Comamonas sp. NLF-1-9]QXL84517.1 peroxide stress protein YaaA [Comamonas sp. NLF-1-9]
MLFLLSPAKSLDYVSPLPQGLPAPTEPRLLEHTHALIALLREKSPQQIAALMSISDKLAALNVARYAAFSEDPAPANARPAALAFNGDVYDGLQAASLGTRDLQWAQAHLAILSGLYGVLRPLDAMQPYRLEMGTRLANARGANLYQFWGMRISETLNAQLGGARSPVVVNLASQEYFKAVDTAALKARVLSCVFEDYKGGSYKIISFHAKRARGLMARWAIEQRASRPEQLQEFDRAGYAFAPAASSAERLVFRRKEAQ